MRRLAALAICILLTFAKIGGARAQATLVSGLGGPQGYGTSCLPPNDDGSWPPDMTGLDLTPAFPSGLHFYTGSYTTAWINTNGNLSFEGALPTFTPNAFPGAPEPMIAPFWADVDTRAQAECNDEFNYPDGEGFPSGATCASGPDYSSEPTTNSIWWSLTPGQMVVTWDQVGFYQCHATPVMSFQMILTTSACGATLEDGGAPGADFNIEFRYNQCGWEAGDANGGENGFCPPGTDADAGSCTPAQAGFDSAGMPDTNFASLPMSLQSGVANELCTGSNLTPPQAGVWQFLVRGGQILCPTAGQPCQTGQPGICADGQLTCSATGSTTCTSLTGPQAPQCNGLDNNCDGKVDDGPCPAGTICDGTACVPACTEGGCGTGETCSNGLCVPTDCVGVTCPTGEVCRNGTCVDACTGVTCPIGQVCREGTCVDPCAGLNCGTGQVCENGSCVPTCPCTACTTSQTCITTGSLAGQCVDSACATVTCQAGFVCQNGACVDECTGAVCPGTQVCQKGQCVAGSSMSEDAGGPIGIMIPDASSYLPPSDGGTIISALDDGGATTGFGGEGSAKSGCGCRAAGSTSGGGCGIAAALGLIASAVRRRRRERTRGARVRTPGRGSATQR